MNDTSTANSDSGEMDIAPNTQVFSRKQRRGHRAIARRALNKAKSFTWEKGLVPAANETIYRLTCSCPVKHALLGKINGDALLALNKQTGKTATEQELEKGLLYGMMGALQKQLRCSSTFATIDIDSLMPAQEVA